MKMYDTIYILLYKATKAIAVNSTKLLRLTLVDWS